MELKVVRFMMDEWSPKLREEWAGHKIRKQHKISEGNLRQVTFTQKKIAYQERFCDWCECEENSKIRSKLGFSKRVSARKHCHKCSLDGRCLKCNAILNNHEENSLRSSVEVVNTIELCGILKELRQHRKSTYAANMV